MQVKGSGCQNCIRAGMLAFDFTVSALFRIRSLHVLQT